MPDGLAYEIVGVIEDRELGHLDTEGFDINSILEEWVGKRVRILIEVESVPNA